MSRTLTPEDKAIIANMRAAADKRQVGDQPTDEEKDYTEALAHLVMREVHRRGGTPVSGTPNVRGIRIERTPEQQAEHERTLRREGRRLGREAVGLKFTLGRKAGTKGAIRKAVERLLKKRPDMKNPELWDAIAAKPPEGWEFLDNSQGRYAEGPSRKTGKGFEAMSYGRFCNICGEERAVIAAASTHEARRG